MIVKVNAPPEENNHQSDAVAVGWLVNMMDLLRYVSEGT